MSYHLLNIEAEHGHWLFFQQSPWVTVDAVAARSLIDSGRGLFVSYGGYWAPPEWMVISSEQLVIAAPPFNPYEAALERWTA